MNIICYCFLSLLLLSCTVPTDSGSNAAATTTTLQQPGGETTTTTTTTTVAGDLTDDQTSSTTTSTTVQPQGSVVVTFRNNSDYDVNIYIGVNPYYGSAVLTVGKGARVNRNVIPSESVTGDTFYFEYLIPIGNEIFPYWPVVADVGYKTMLLSKTAANELVIDSLTECPTNNSYILLENKTTSDIYMNRKAGDAGFRMNPYGQSSTYNIPQNGSAVYEISDESQSLKPSQVQFLRIVRNVFNEQTLPISNTDPGMIYTVTVTNESAVLKSVTPFDIDLQRQIWQIECEPTVVDCVCRSYSVEGGTVLLGSKSADTLYGAVCDKYGKQHSFNTIPLSGLKTKDSAVDYSFVYDGLENSDGSVVLIADIVYDDEDVTDDIYLLCYNPTVKAFSWVYNLSDCIGDNKIEFRWSCQNMIISRDNDIYAMGCAVVDNDENMHRFFAEFDCSDVSDIKVRIYKSDETTDYSESSHIETMFCSIYYDDASARYIAVGYHDFDSSYPSDHTHYGVVYGIHSDESGDLSADLIYSAENCLFLGIDGIGSDYYICGEIMLTGKILQGCYLSSNMIAQNVSPKHCSSVRTHSWYNQICVFEDKIICSGQTSSDFGGEVDSMAIVTAFDLQDNLLWENQFEDWSEADSCFPNGIGSYIIELFDRSSDRSAIVSADLLGKNTGKLVGNIK